MNINPHLSFENTAVAFSSKSNPELRKTFLLFSAMNYPWLVKIGTTLVSLALKLRLPVKKFIKSTLFDHFCGGESIHDAIPSINKLAQANIFTILDFSAEGEENEDEFEQTTHEQLRIVDFAAENDSIPFTVMKISGIASNELLEKLQTKVALTPAEEEAWNKVKSRVMAICQKSYDHDVRIMFDAEETWIQEPIDEVVYEMMGKFNREKPIIWQTFQMYRHDMLANLKKAYDRAATHDYWLGAKLVRGAYMEKERDRAQENGYLDPIQPDKNATDNDYDRALEFCLDHRQRIAVFAGTHNEQSCAFLASLMGKFDLQANDPLFWFGQLYGMSDNISYSLAKEGYNVAKYVPYGPVEKVLPYLFRRAEENTSIAGQSGREYRLVKEEIRRRKEQKSAVLQ